MESRKVDAGWLVRFAHGEDIVGGMLAFARAEKIRGAWVNMLGAIEDPELGYYHLDTRQYTRRRFPGDWEITAIVGNLGWLGDAPVLHVHATIGGPDFETRGGHLFAGRAGATCEVFVRDLGTDLTRARDEAIGLALWRLAGS
ncbi:MAG: PPC domain-containing DNA-binding protein [Candidatus Eisenbacteria bacterium]